MTRGIVVETKFIGPTDFRGARVKATCFRGSVVVSFDHALHIEGAHRAAVYALMAKFWPKGSQDILAEGEHPSGVGYTYIISYPESV